MLNMNSPVVQNLMQSGFNPYMNNGYVPQQPQQNTYTGYIPGMGMYGYNPQQNMYGYNPYIANQQAKKNETDNWIYSYDPMPDVVYNEARGINSRRVQPVQQGYNYNNQFYNQSLFSGYTNPILMRNQEEANRLRQREEAINQGRIWRALFKGNTDFTDEFDLDESVRKIESLYYQEPVKEDIPFKDKVILEKNAHFGELETRLEYYKQNNIPIIDNRFIMKQNLCNYMNHINSIIGDPENCDMVDYFTRVYPELRFEQLSYEADRFNKNRKNSYNNGDFNKVLNKAAADKPDSYYYKIMESFADNGVRLETPDGITITPDEMEIRLPDRLLKSRQEKYYQQRQKFYETVFNKGES